MSQSHTLQDEETKKLLLCPPMRLSSFCDSKGCSQELDNSRIQLDPQPAGSASELEKRYKYKTLILCRKNAKTRKEQEIKAHRYRYRYLKCEANDFV